LATAYASADIFVFPGTTDTFGNVILEAQACGVPVIASDSGGSKELVEDRTNGLITRSRDADDFTRAIRSLAQTRHCGNVWAMLPERVSSTAAGQTHSANSGPLRKSESRLALLS
jgi:glycosyltransferase involved in cell wall biosynthesis